MPQYGFEIAEEISKKLDIIDYGERLEEKAIERIAASPVVIDDQPIKNLLMTFMLLLGIGAVGIFGLRVMENNFDTIQSTITKLI